MNWLNINVQILDSENFLGSDPIDRATWLCLLRYCIGQENGGVITDCDTWADRKWQQLVRITKEESTRKSDLWHWDGNSLIVWGYPIEKQHEVQDRRERAKTNGVNGGRPKKTNVGSEKKPTLDSFAKAEGEGEGEGEENTPLPPVGGIGQSEDPAPKPKRRRLLTQAEKQRIKHPEVTLVMQRIGSWFGRQPETKWSIAEVEALQAVEPPEKELNGMELYYLADIPPEENIRRRSLITLLNNWPGELDRARQHYRETHR